ncbi:induced myeloid leukemia cell differentiation protein Mcl-1 [Ornithorhynchus anatinus]|uniref:MCL1 apoptosis regulator, BCL2 family member n=1 Tax=Ornithorhynchus anatinus TaxID=9258 RepID=A0A6I8PBY3_ORNAN|nr:induced myeloid leukemia cell differentiation protein Mcl-1 [Ornithorhynchus anatinus]
MLGLQKNAVIGLNLYCGGAGSGAGASPPGGRLRPDKAAAVGEGPAAAAAAAARRAGGGGEAAAPLIGGGAGASPSAAAGLGVARPAPIGAEGPDVIGTLAPARRAPPEGTEPPPPSAAAAAAALLRPEDELDGYEPEAPAKRPAHLAVLDLPGQAGGSLPSTPPPDDRDDMADGLYRQSLELITHYLREQAAGRKDEPRGRDRRALETLRRVGDGIQRNHETAFQGMLRKLDIQKEEDLKAVSRVGTHVFNDGTTNWGRIVTLISFGAFVAKHLKSINQEGCIDPLAESITEVLVTTKRDWLVKQKGWEGFVEFFHVEDMEGSVRNVLLLFAGVASLGAGLAYLIR